MGKFGEKGALADATLTDSGLEWLIRVTSGDCRQALSILELGLNHSEELSTAIFESLPIQRFGNYSPIEIPITI